LKEMRNNVNIIVCPHRTSILLCTEHCFWCSQKKRTLLLEKFLTFHVLSYCHNVYSSMVYVFKKPNYLHVGVKIFNFHMNTWLI
jgi:hypothetical protein